MKAPRESWVTLPLEALWNEQGAMRATRVRPLAHGDVLALLNAGPVHFVVAEPRRPIRWVAKADASRFWQEEARAWLASGDDAGAPGPSRRSTSASEWSAPAHTPHPIVVLERRR